ncbi:DUF4169 family protein [uncultured Roseibium sp.]|uniref:DUF4169 family protein n=1 Tax=uncultured Roseibium sp. TaxID=1936171 RepID=UPI002592C31B|nr:DUF4169 family protein [uncultured Roseibium sp.]
MSADIVNLRQARKKKARSDREKQAAENRTTFGRSKAEKQLSQKTETLTSARLDGHQRSDETRSGNTKDPEDGD